VKKIILTAVLLMSLICTAAFAETGVAYNVYHMEGDAMDSLIRATVEVEDSKITAVKFDEDGYWTVTDAVSGATLAGTPNYLLLAQEAYQKAIG